MKNLYTKSKSLLLGLALAWSSTLAVQAAAPGGPPSNDLCSGAITVSCGDVVNGTTVDATATGAPTEYGTSEGVWYKLAGNDQLVTVATCGSTDPNFTDTEIGVFLGDCSNRLFVGSDDDACNPGNHSTFTFEAWSGFDYYIYVGDYSTTTGAGGNQGAFQLSVTCAALPVPLNDLCGSATAMACGDFFVGSTAAATATGELACTGNGDPGVWYSFVGDGTDYTISADGSGFDTYLAISTSCGGACVASNDDISYPSNLNAEISGFTTTNGQTYYIYLTSTWGESGTYLLELTSSACTPPANDECADAIVLTPGATCTATVGNNGSATPSSQAEACAGTYDDDVWFSFVAVATDAVVNVTGSADFDAVVQVLSGSCGSPTSLDCVDGSGSAGLETVSLTGLTIGQSYLVRVADYYSTATPTTTTFDICVVSTAAPAAECDNSGADGLYPTTPTTPDAGGAVTQISDNQYEGSEYSVITAMVSGDYYQLTHEAGSYITVREGAVAGVVVASGFSPLGFFATSAADIYVHWTLDAACTVGQTGSFLTTVQNFGAGPCDMSVGNGGDGQWPSSTVTPDAGGAVTTISTNQYAGSEYSVVSSLDGHEYVFTHANGAYITVRIGTVTGPVLGSGLSPLVVQATSTGNLYVHWTSDSDCVVDGTGSFLTTVQDLGLPPCDNTLASGLYPTNPTTPDAGGAVTDIATDQYEGSEYSVITGIVASSIYEFTHAAGSYITVRVGTVNGPVLGSGYSPLQVSTVTTDDLYVHWTLDEFCASSGASGSFLTTVQLLGADCLADAGTATADASQVCLIGGSATVSVTPNGDQVIPAGYSLVAVLADVNGNLLNGGQLSYTVNATGNYYIHVGVVADADQGLYSVQPTLAGLYALTIDGGGSLCGSLDLVGSLVSVVICPDNDLCANAELISCGDVVAGTNVNATEQAVPTYNSGTVGQGVWYTFTGTGGDVTLSTCGDATFDTEVNVVTSADCVNFTNVAGNDDFAGCSGSTSEVTFTSVAAQTYYVYVSDYASGGSEVGTFNLTLTCDPVTGITEGGIEDINVYPNPSNGQFVVEVNGVDADAQIIVMDIAGRQVYNQGVTMNGRFRKELNLNVATGTYLLQIATVDGTVTRKIQIN